MRAGIIPVYKNNKNEWMMQLVQFPDGITFFGHGKCPADLGTRFIQCAIDSAKLDSNGLILIKNTDDLANRREMKYPATGGVDYYHYKHVDAWDIKKSDGTLIGLAVITDENGNKVLNNKHFEILKKALGTRAGKGIQLFGMPVNSYIDNFDALRNGTGNVSFDEVVANENLLGNSGLDDDLIAVLTNDHFKKVMGTLR